MSQAWQVAVFGAVVTAVVGPLCVWLGYWLANRANQRQTEAATEAERTAKEEAAKRRRRSVEESVRGEARRLEIATTALRVSLPGTPEGKLPARPNPATLLSVLIDGSPLLLGERREETALLDDGMRERFDQLAAAWAKYDMHVKTLRTTEAGVWIDEKTLALLDHLQKSAGELKQ
jgi:hypothetical protein